MSKSNSRAGLVPALLITTLGVASAQTPTLVADLQPGTASSNISATEAVDLNGALLFRASSPGVGLELHRSDGTAAGTSLVADLSPGVNSGFPNQLTILDRVAYFVATLGLNNTELYRSDGTANGTFRIRDIAPGPDGSRPEQLVAAGPRLFFTAWTRTGGRELWVSNGTAAGTVQVADLTPGPGSTRIEELTAVEDRVFFAATTLANGRELWTSDGTASGTRLVADIRPGPTSTLIRELTAVQSTLYFVANDGVRGRELWVSDGFGTRPIDLVRGPASSLPSNLTRVGRDLFFIAQDANRRTFLYVQPWFGFLTRQLRELPPNGLIPFRDFVATADRLFFVRDSVAEGREVWTSDGTTAGTVIVRNIAPGATSSDPLGLAALGSRRVAFRADDGQFGQELWISDGTPLGTRRLSDLIPGPGDSSPDSIAISRGVVYFVAGGVGVGRELHRVEVGAIAQPFGRGCSFTRGRIPTLAATDPIAGGAFTIFGDRARAGDSWVLNLGAPSNGSPFVVLGCASNLDIFAPTTTLFSSTVPFTGSFTNTIPTPLALPGTVAALEVVLLPSSGFRLVERSNGVLLRFGI